LESVLTIVGGKVVYAAQEFADLGPPDLPVSPDWSPVKEYGGYCNKTAVPINAHGAAPGVPCTQGHRDHRHLQVFGESGLWALGCDCFAF
jgi:hypothetical protein